MRTSPPFSPTTSNSRPRSGSFRFAAAAVLGALALAGCSGGGVPARKGPGLKPLADGKAAMRERLARITRDTTPGDNRFLNGRRAEALRATLGTVPDPVAQVPIRAMLATELLNAGRTKESLAQLEELDRLWESIPPEKRPGDGSALRELAGLAWLRWGEQSNCILHHGSESCILPIEGSGVHRDQTGSRRAMALFQGLLERDPSNLRVGWLLNIAAMTVGEWPHGIDPRFRIGPEVFASEYDIGRFRDVAIPSGLLAHGLSGGVVVEDLDLDGDIDVLFSHMAMDASPVLFLNNGDGTFVNARSRLGLDGLHGGLNLVPADYDNDGDVDVMLLRGAWMDDAGHYPNSLLRNRGDASFEDVTEAAGILTFHPTQTAAWADYDGDGWLDLFVGNESTAKRPHPSELWRNRGDGTFEDRGRDLPHGADFGYVKGVAWGDYDNDGRPDLAISAFDSAEDYLIRNEGPGPDGSWRFRDVTREAGPFGPTQSFPIWFFDYDNDGWLDLLINGYYAEGAGDVAAHYLGLPNRVQVPHLYRNRGDGRFEDVTERTRIGRVALTMGANFGDLDNDGWLDTYHATGEPALSTLMPNRMFRNDGGKVFQDVTTSGGFGHLQKGHGVAFVDLDEDGDQDIVVEMGGAFEGDTAYNLLFENPGHGNRWITLRLEGRQANRSAIGARVRARTSGPEGPRSIYLTAGTGGSFGASSLQQEMGLGKATSLDELEVRWPGSGRVQTFRNVAMDTIYKLVEGGELEPVPARRVRLGGAARAPREDRR